MEPQEEKVTHKVDLDEISVLELQFGEAEKPACWYKEHDEDWEAHSGEVNWYMQFGCKHCGRTTSVDPFCDGFRNWVHTYGNYIECSQCFKHTHGWESVVLCKRIDGNW